MQITHWNSQALEEIINSNDRKQCTVGSHGPKKVFDTINHGILLNKLEGCGIIGKVLEWERSYEMQFLNRFGTFLESPSLFAKQEVHFSQ